jgi:PAS domain S-box-containing protein
MTYTPDDSPSELRARIEAQQTRLLELCFDARTGELRDRPLAQHLGRLTEILAQMDRNLLLNLKILPDVAASAGSAVNPPAPATALRRESEELVILRHLADASGHGFMVADLHGNVVYANPTMAALLGVPGPRALEERSLQPYYSAATAEMLDREIIPTVAEKGQWIGELEMLSATGEPIATHHRLFILHGQLGRETYVGGLVIDIRPQKQTLEALRASEQNFRALVESANDGILIAIATGDHVYANARAAEITGYTTPELCRMNLAELAHPEELERLTRLFQRRLETGEGPRSYPTRIRHKSGREIYVEVTGARTLWHGQPADTVMIRDITRRREIERALRESEERYATVVERGLDGIAIVQEERIVFANQPLGKLLGCGSEELVGLPFLEIVMPEQRERVAETYRQMLARNEDAAYGISGLRRRDGTEARLEAYGTVVRFRGRHALMVVIRHPVPPLDRARGDTSAGHPGGGA